MIHKINVSIKDFSNVISGKKTFGIIFVKENKIAVGDLLALNEYDETETHTGNSCLVYVDYIEEKHPYVTKECAVVSFKPCEVGKFDRPYRMETMCADYRVPYATRGDAK